MPKNFLLRALAVNDITAMVCSPALHLPLLMTQEKEGVEKELGAAKQSCMEFQQLVKQLQQQLETTQLSMDNMRHALDEVRPSLLTSMMLLCLHRALLMLLPC